MRGWFPPVVGRLDRRKLQAALLWALFAGAVWSVNWLVQTPTADAQGIERGETRENPVRTGAILWQRDCVSCHGVQGEGTPWGPAIQDKGPASVHLMVSTGRMPITDLSYLEHEPPGEEDRQVPRGEVDYLPSQVEALVAYSRTILDGPDVPVVDVAGADVSTGFELFQRNCAACHAWSGRGGTLTNGHVATSLEQSTPQQVVEAMRTGIGTMPDFPETAIGEDEAAAIAAYVQYLEHPRNVGGQPLAYVGPVAEGFAAWLVGILGLMLFVRWIGKQT